MKIAIGCDHGGYALKETLKQYLIGKGYEVEDCGTDSMDSCNYPVFARRSAECVASGACAFGIVVCTTGEGVCITANKVPGIRCGLIYNKDVAYLTRNHNDANMMAIGAKYTSEEEAKAYVDIFLSAEFAGGRHKVRVDMIEKA